MTHNNSVSKVMLNYRRNGRRQIGRPLNRLLDEAKTGLSKPDTWPMIMIMNFSGLCS